MMRKVLVILLVISVTRASKTINREIFKHLGDSCQLSNSENPGECRFLRDCIDYYKKTAKITVCGLNRGRETIICCPQFEFKQFTSECVVRGTNENGFHKLIKHCPRIAEEVEYGAPFPRVCDYEICRDMVCCPVGGLRRKNEVCYEYDDASYTIQNRIKQEDYCTINRVQGMYRKRHDCNYSPAVMNQRICHYDFCENIVCCPMSDVVLSFTNALEDRQFVDIVGGSCVDKTTGEAGICKPDHRCYDFNPLNRNNYTSCGFEFCIHFSCCTFPKFTSRSLQGWFSLSIKLSHHCTNVSYTFNM